MLLRPWLAYPELRERYAERAAIAEFHGGLSRDEAESLAAREVEADLRGRRSCASPITAVHKR